jgi:hypothetical protein
VVVLDWERITLRNVDEDHLESKNHRILINSSILSLAVDRNIKRIKNKENLLGNVQKWIPVDCRNQEISW